METEIWIKDDVYINTKLRFSEWFSVAHIPTTVTLTEGADIYICINLN
jgi:hypothetical protein